MFPACRAAPLPGVTGHAFFLILGSPVRSGPRALSLLVFPALALPNCAECPKSVQAGRVRHRICADLLGVKMLRARSSMAVLSVLLNQCEETRSVVDRFACPR